MYAWRHVQLTGTNRPRAWFYINNSMSNWMFVLAVEFLKHCLIDKNIKVSVAMAVGSHPFPFRTRKLSPPAPMVLGRRRPGRVGRRRISQKAGSHLAPRFRLLAVNASRLGRLWRCLLVEGLPASLPIAGGLLSSGPIRARAKAALREAERRRIEGLMGGAGLIGATLMGGAGLIGATLIAEGLRAGEGLIAGDLKAGEGSSRLHPRGRGGWDLWPARVRPRWWSHPWNPRKRHHQMLSKKRRRRLRRPDCGPSGERLAKPELRNFAPRLRKPFSGAT